MRQQLGAFFASDKRCVSVVAALSVWMCRMKVLLVLACALLAVSARKSYDGHKVIIEK